MDFFEVQEQARKKSRRMVLWFALTVLGIVALVHLTSMLAFYVWDYDGPGLQLVRLNGVVFAILFLTCLYWLCQRETWDKIGAVLGLILVLPITGVGVAVLLFQIGATYPNTADFRLADAFLLWNDVRPFCVSLLVGFCIAAASLYKIGQISRGGGVLIAKQLGGHKVERNTFDPAERRLLNVIDEMAIAAGIPAPVAFVLPKETSLNAFAAGLSMRDSVIAVTRGLLDAMNRDELQGVIAHEISHIVHGDCHLNTRLIGILHGIYVVTIIGLDDIRVEDENRVTGEVEAYRPFIAFQLFIAPTLRAIGSIGVFFGRLIQASVSRECEYLADAAAVQFTRNPDGLVSALRKLWASGSKIGHPEAMVASHLFFGASEKPSSFASRFATHPPLTDRIRRIGSVILSSPELERPKKQETFQTLNLEALEANQPRILAANPHAALPAVLPVAIAMNHIAGEEIAPEGVAHAQALLASLPEPLRQEAASVAGATGIVCGLFFSSQPDLRLQQEKLLPPAALPVAQKLVQWLILQPEQGAQYRLVWLDLALPTLRDASKDECRQLLVAVKESIRINRRISPGEFALFSILQNALLPPSERRVNKSELRPEQLSRDIASLLALMAYAGHEEVEKAKAAYQTAIARSPADRQLPFPDRKDFSLKLVSQAFSHLALATPPYRKKILEACAVAAQHDGKITPVENELLRAFAQSLDCPAPLRW